ncbi:MAG TPA: hypothetical protein VM871_07960, partial [Flavisolibacter sp.]|nr:hypothetical protein [Flavisolibacter sp.]
MVSTVTLYRSPVRLVKHAFEETDVYSSQAIARARKKLMAEISLSGDEIQLDDIAYSRNDASTLLDLVSEEDWKVHSVIYAHKGLLHFLEKETFNDEDLKRADAYLYNTNFVQTVSPYFAHSFNAVSGRLLKAENFDELAKLLNYQGYIIPEHSHEAYQKIRTHLSDLAYTLRNLSWEKFVVDESLLHFVFSDEWKRFLNALPSSFTAQRDELVETLINIVLHFQHKATWYYLHRVLVQLRSIETNDFNRSEIERIDKIIYHNSKLEGGRTKKVIRDSNPGISGRAIWWGIWIVLMIVRAATCNDRSKSDYGFDASSFKRIQESQRQSQIRNYEKQNENYLLNFFDSLSNTPRLPVEKLPLEIQTGGQPFSSFADALPQAGGEEITVTNNTGYNCVLLYFEGVSEQGSVYQGTLSHTLAAYIRKGGTHAFRTVPGTGRFYFIFGDKWGKLKTQAELSVTGDDGGYNDNSGRKQTLFVYEFFSNKKPLSQTFLKQSVHIDYPSAPTDEKLYRRINTPAKTGEAKPTHLNLLEKTGNFFLEAEGSLAVKVKNQFNQQAHSADSLQRKIADALRRAGAEVKEE